MAATGADGESWEGIIKAIAQGKLGSSDASM